MCSFLLWVTPCWSKTTLKPGDKVTVTYHPLKDGSKGGTYQKVMLSDGKELMNIG